MKGKENEVKLIVKNYFDSLQDNSKDSIQSNVDFVMKYFPSGKDRFVVTWSNGAVKGYVNNILIVNTSYIGTISNASININKKVDNLFTGIGTDNYQIYDVAKSADWVKQDYLKEIQC